MMRLIPIIAAAPSVLLCVPAFAQEFIEYSNQKDFFSFHRRFRFLSNAGIGTSLARKLRHHHVDAV